MTINHCMYVSTVCTYVSKYEREGTEQSRMHVLTTTTTATTKRANTPACRSQWEDHLAQFTCVQQSIATLSRRPIYNFET